MWCDACRSVGIIHCAHPDECGNMLSNRAAAESWNAWLDDLPIDAKFHPALDRLQDFIAGLAMPTPDHAAIREAAMREAADVAIGIDLGWHDGISGDWHPHAPNDLCWHIHAAILALIKEGAAE